MVGPDRGDDADMQMPRGPLVVVGAVVAATALGVALYLFQPWTLVVDERVSEALPVAATSSALEPSEDVTPPAPTDAAGETSAAPSAQPTASTPATPSTQRTPTPSGPVELARGELISHEHATTGTARVLLLDDGTRVLRLEGLDTSNGPDLHVWLTDAPVLEGRAGWFVFDDGAFVDLGELRGNQGDANYPLPSDVDLEDLTSVSIWCERFSVSFGAAELA